MFPLAIQAKVDLDAQNLLENPWVHDMAHVLLNARLKSEAELGLFGPASR